MQTLANHLSKINLFRPVKKPQTRAVSIRAYGSAENRSWFFRIDDAADRSESIGCDFGQLPEYEFGWTQETATFYALCNAARWLRLNRPELRVTLTNISAPSRKVERKERRWAA
jgi:hypothetical protein